MCNLQVSPRLELLGANRRRERASRVSHSPLLVIDSGGCEVRMRGVLRTPEVRIQCSRAVTLRSEPVIVAVTLTATAVTWSRVPLYVICIFF